MYREYKMLASIQPDSLLDDVNAHYTGVNQIVTSIPLKRITLEDFFTEFDHLILTANIKIPIGREDGRPFSFEVSRLLEDRVHSLSNEFSTLTEGDVMERSHRVQVTNVACPWHKFIELQKKTDPDYCNYLKTLQPLQKIDFEVQYQLELLKLNNVEQIKDQLTDQLKNFDSPTKEHPGFGSISGQRHVKAQEHRSNSSMNKSGKIAEEQVEPPQNYKRSAQHFHFGMLLPVYELSEFTCHVLDAKKEDFIKALKVIESAKNIQADILRVDPERAKHILIPPAVRHWHLNLKRLIFRIANGDIHVFAA